MRDVALAADIALMLLIWHQVVPKFVRNRKSFAATLSNVPIDRDGPAWKISRSLGVEE